jgi:DNA-binding TFAR19-related protein (PDSD5 family)
MSDYDPELEIIKARKLRELKKKATSDKKAKEVKSDRDLLIENLVDRGMEVLAAAESQYPRETAIIVTKLAEFIRNGELQDKISGGALLSLFRTIGLRVRMDTKISVEEHGKLVSLSDRLKSKED